MSGERTTIVVVGSVPNKLELLKFNKAFAKSRLFKHQSRTALITQKEHGTREITLYVQEGHEDTIEQAFERGRLRHWKNNFEIQEEVL